MDLSTKSITEATWLELFEYSKFIGAVYRQSKHDFQQELVQLDVRAAQSDVLMFVYHNPGLTQQQIASGMTVDASLLARDLRVMVKRQWVQRRDNAADHRAKIITLTPAGTELAQQLKTITNRWWAQLFAQHPEIDSQVFGEQLELVRQALVGVVK
jgi:DNA-binding MarR family transcriptional regulator